MPGAQAAAVAADLFDMQLRAMRRDRAFRHGPELFLHERSFGDCLGRLSLVARPFASALLVGCPDPGWPVRLGVHARTVDVMEPGPLFAAAAGGRLVEEDRWTGAPRVYDLCVAVGTLDTVNDLAGALHRIRAAMAGDSLLIGALAGGDSLPRLRAAMFAADRMTGAAAPHVHPRIDGPSLANLLAGCGFVMPVVDIDRVDLSYPSLRALVRDLRRMGATNLLQARPRKMLSRSALRAAEQAFAAAGEGGRTVEQVEILHFAAWTPAVTRVAEPPLTVRPE